MNYQEFKGQLIDLSEALGVPNIPEEEIQSQFDAQCKAMEEFKAKIADFVPQLGEDETIPEETIEAWFDDPDRDMNERELVTLYFINSKQKMKSPQERLIELNNLRDRAVRRLQELPEYKIVQQLNTEVDKVKQEIKEEEEKLKQEQFEKTKQELIDAGFELRHGHMTGASNQDGRTSDNGEPYTFLVVHCSRPKILEIFEWSKGQSIAYEDERQEFKQDWIGHGWIGHGESEEDAWLDAINNWADEEIRAIALDIATN